NDGLVDSVSGPSPVPSPHASTTAFMEPRVRARVLDARRRMFDRRPPGTTQNSARTIPRYCEFLRGSQLEPSTAAPSPPASNRLHTFGRGRVGREQKFSGRNNW